MKRTSYVGIAALCLAVAILAAAAAGAGVFLRGGGETSSTTSLRGEHYDYLTEGVYALNEERFVAEGVGWDMTTLFLVVPAMLLLLPWLGRGSMRASLAALGLLAYLFYQYLMYSVAWAFGPLFPLHVAIYSASAATIAWILSRVSVSEVAACATESFPRRGMAALCAVISLVLMGMWIPRIVSALGGEVEGIFFGQSTLVVQAMDLGMIVPLAVFTAVTAWQGRPIGYLLSSVLVVKTLTMATAICAMLVVAWQVEGALEVVPFTMFAVFAALATLLGARMLASMRTAVAQGGPTYTS